MACSLCDDVHLGASTMTNRLGSTCMGATRSWRGHLTVILRRLELSLLKGAGAQNSRTAESSLKNDAECIASSTELNLGPLERSSYEQHRLYRRRSRHHSRHPGVSRTTLKRQHELLAMLDPFLTWIIADYASLARAHQNGRLDDAWPIPVSPQPIGHKSEERTCD